ncbi:MAG: OmpA family protein [Myxococcaceae bacterium]|nr:OmpA family protein [Myxococcaceae bacterium]
MSRSFPTRVFSRVTACAVLTAALAGCPPTYPKCESDDQCKEHGEVCVQGECKECATDTNCKAGFVCDANKCVPKPECKDDGSCGPNKKCNGGKCVEASGREPGTCKDVSDCGSGEDCKGGRCVSKSGGASCSAPATEPGSPWAPVRFDFNEHKLSASGQQTLNTLADCIKAAPNTKVTLEGHADERGTEEFNLQLSNRRAASVKRYLMDLGVKDSDIETVGYGENRPASSGGDEAAWAANRRVEIRKR